MIGGKPLRKIRSTVRRHVRRRDSSGVQDYHSGKFAARQAFEALEASFGSKSSSRRCGKSCSGKDFVRVSFAHL